VHDLVDVHVRAHRRDLEQDVRTPLRGARVASAPLLAVQLVDPFRLFEEARAAQVALNVGGGGELEARPFDGAARNGPQRKQAQHAVRVQPAYVPGVEEHAFVAAGDERAHERVEAAFIQLTRHLDQVHVAIRPWRKRWSPVAPRCSTLRAAALFAVAIASSSDRPVSRLAKQVAPQTSPQPVGSPSRGPPICVTCSLRTAPGTASGRRAASPGSYQLSGCGRNAGDATYAAPRSPSVTHSRRRSSPTTSAAKRHGSPHACASNPSSVSLTCAMSKQRSHSRHAASGCGTRYPAGSTASSSECRSA